MKVPVVLEVNGDRYEVQVEPTRTLVDVLREEIGLTGTKKGCAEGECGACTVLMEGKPVDSCLVLAVHAQGKEITTIEGLGKTGEMDVIQKAYIENGAVQCGYCSPGFIMVTKALLDKCPDPKEEDVRHAFAGNLCRCTGYQKIVDSVLEAARRVREEEKSE